MAQPHQGRHESDRGGRHIASSSDLLCHCCVKKTDLCGQQNTRRAGRGANDRLSLAEEVVCNIWGSVRRKSVVTRQPSGCDPGVLYKAGFGLMAAHSDNAIGIQQDCAV